MWPLGDLNIVLIQRSFQLTRLMKRENRPNWTNMYRKYEPELNFDGKRMDKNYLAI